MYEMLTGRVPFDGDNPVTVALKHINEEIIPPSEIVDGIPPALERAVMKATNKYQTNRYSSAEEMIEDLDNIAFVTNVAGSSIFAESSDVVEKRNKRMRAQLEAEVEQAELNKNKNKKKSGSRKKLVIIIVAASVVLLSLIGVLIAWKMGTFSSTKPAPDLMDKTIEEAKAIAEEEGFRLKQGKDIYSADYSEGRICLQDPEPGTEMPKNGTITVNLSKGSKDGMVPNVVGMQKEDVEKFLAQYGYVLGNVIEETSPEKAGKVLEQSPVAGSSLEKESAVDITVSDGKGVEKGTVPSVTNMSLDDAKKAIKAAGFKVGNVTYDWDNNVGKGYVIYQQYQANSLLDKGTSIDIQVSSGPEPKPETPEEDDDEEGGDDFEETELNE
jgi:serine/threonine-protein kinase